MVSFGDAGSSLAMSIEILPFVSGSQQRVGNRKSSFLWRGMEIVSPGWSDASGGSDNAVRFTQNIRRFSFSLFDRRVEACQYRFLRMK